MSNQVSITDLLTAIGSDNIKYQYLVNCMENIKAGKGRTIITFGTDAITTTEVALNTGPRALIIWVDGELMSQRLRELKTGELQANIPVVDELDFDVEFEKGEYARQDEQFLRGRVDGWNSCRDSMLAAAPKEEGGAA